MQKKSFVPPRLVKGKQYWYILFYQVHPLTNELVRFRETKNLNRIPSIREREKAAKRYMAEIYAAMMKGYPFEQYIQPEKNKTVLEGLTIALDCKRVGMRKRSIDTLESKSRIFVKWLEETNQAGMYLYEFDRFKVREFLKWIDKKKVAAVTWNNYVTRLKSLWNQMIDEEIIDKNPWNKIKLRAEKEKKRRIFTPEQRKLILQEAWQADRGLFFVLVIQYYCFIRPAELRRLKMSDFDFKAGIIHLDRADTKMQNKSRHLTLPAALIKYFDIDMFRDVPGQYYFLGKNLRPGMIQAPENLMYNRHRKLLERLAKEGKISNIQDLTLYSWKDTGITDLSAKVPPFKLRDQTGHGSFEMLLRYYHQDPVNPAIRQLEVDF